ncbi:hypothetical protein [Candidatus Sororendozoicomonas aggregata]|uniref:hypothetical protein n=1 Tax=Candidatus Sororendozoicomonas aggregata TaxID=3073239 RepID=UPI002ED31CCA
MPFGKFFTAISITAGAVALTVSSVSAQADGLPLQFKQEKREVKQNVRQAKREVKQDVRQAKREVKQDVRQAKRNVKQTKRNVKQDVRQAKRNVNVIGLTH